MRLIIDIDGIRHEIDSTDPETLGRWVVEIFNRVKNPSPATQFRVSAWPSYIYDDAFDTTGHADWIQDSRYLRDGIARNPRELVKLLGEFLDEAETGNS